ncbi:PilZ domain-containing protein [Pseudoalteromonas sp. SR44-5]|uniref:PilZ domain-containing protein n=1 Tax=Pseudoalteromonas TaxID=53246 RepID=UPI0016019971|nr:MULTISPECIES: PilZ domain-containing protein [unclassified Pseudoalteromonas]MBB1368972.1 PilZ domain-containing protein [Pseudoalteromonas sp. SR44-5]MBB1419913.1 PilZ domain-containing protein [Pseudoalteromonas sp. SG44-1]MBB1436803.1 PilZ domain-containing protein [Pseudoalteromonas sp. SG43-6]MBB1470777.1 PilZ domain-containing protein [Pseudoalteromonas sp. SG41-5]
MTEDTLLKYESLVDELKSYLGNAKFDTIFKSKTAGLTKPEQFLIKMEMSRLSQPIARFIDLRGQVTGQVKPYEYEGKQHFMDETAIAVFEQAIERHGGYTLAVYEAVMNTDNNHRVMQKKAAEQAKQPELQNEQKLDCQVIKFASYESRREERMNYSIKITVELSKDNTIAATTSDISLSGAKIKLSPRYQVKKGQLLGLRLVGLEQDFELGLKNGIQYEVVAVEKISSEFNHIRLKRTFIENNEKFDEFLESFIHGNKRRYKVNLDNTLDAVVSKGYEQYYIPRVTSLFTFFSLQNDKLYPSLVLTTENNIFIQRYFCDERKLSCLYTILNQQRLAQLLSNPAPVKEEYLYTFTHVVAGKVYYYSATRTELTAEPQLSALFFGFGSQKESWQCFKVQLMPSHPEDSYIPLSLPNTAGKDIEKLNKPPTPRVQGMIKDVKYLVILTAVGTDAEQTHYQSFSYDKSIVNQLKRFGHGKHKTPPKLETVDLEYVNLRSHKRYLYKTDVVLTTQDEQTHTAHSRDFSVMGLQIECDQPVTFQKGEVVELSLPELQKITKKHTLSKLKYEVMAVSKSFTTINLKALRIADNPHEGVKFFTQLIENNKDKLKVSEEAPKVPGLSTALRNMVTKSVCQFPFYLHKEATHFKTGAIGQGLYPSPLHIILQNYGLLNNTTSIDAFLSPEQLNDVITPLIKDRSRQDPPLPFTLFIRFDPKKSTIEDAIKSKCSAGEDYAPQLLFLKKGLKSELLFIMRIYISRTGRPDTDYLSNELKYVSQYALHKAKDLEEALWAVTGVGDMVDVTDETLSHLDFTAELVEQMNKRKQIWLKRLT